LALMVVWGYPCESKSSPAHYSKHPRSQEWGCFFMGGINIFAGINIKILRKSCAINNKKITYLNIQQA
ncbi:hypothetical protein, partial [Acinetobacter pittii]|uniref:hypothetical protein n=1 Tax=Acinetobacter pittii TaxID=48296 RepID=UPI00301BD999